MSLPEVRLVEGPDLECVPFPVEPATADTLKDPESLRDALGAQRLAAMLLPCVDSRSVHWRYFLLGAPAAGPPLAKGRHLLRILEQTERRGVGRRSYSDFAGDKRRSRAAFQATLATMYQAQYGTAVTAYWSKERKSDWSEYPGKPSTQLAAGARRYVLAGAFDSFFDYEVRSSRLQRMFRTRLINFRPRLAELIIAKDYDLVAVARVAHSPSFWLPTKSTSSSAGRYSKPITDLPTA